MQGLHAVTRLPVDAHRHLAARCRQAFFQRSRECLVVGPIARKDRDIGAGGGVREDGVGELLGGGAAAGMLFGESPDAEKRAEHREHQQHAVIGEETRRHEGIHSFSY